jgi:prephenate dehydrogenase
MTLQTTIVGLGLVGSSIGLALKGTGADLQVIGHDKDSGAAKRAFKSGSVDRTEWNLINACDGADLIILSTPLTEVKSTLVAIAQELKAGCVVTDTAPLKVPVLTWASESLPDTVHFVGGHPIRGLQAPGQSSGQVLVEEPSAELLDGAIYCLTPGTDTAPEALQTVADLAQAVGAQPYYLDAAEHDGLIAAVEGLPLLLAATLQVVASKSPSWREMIRLSGSDFGSITGLLAGDAGDLSERFDLNANNSFRWMDAFLGEASKLCELLAAEDHEALQAFVADALEAREGWTRRQVEGQSVDYSDFDVGRMMFGDMFKSRGIKDK